ncbi:MAG: hypothetical protein NVSMB22_22150 [Chloroflexota bacterium]
MEETDPGVRGIDLFLANEGHLDRGIGSAMVHAYVAALFTDPTVVRVQADPTPENERAIRCFEKVEFRRIRTMDTLDWRALLMHRERENAPGEIVPAYRW